MLLAIHILIAVSSIIFATTSLVKPALTILITSYVAIAVTLATGVVLTVSNPARLAQACMSGLVYISVVFAISYFAQKRLSNI